MSEDSLGWKVTIERNDSKIVVFRSVPNDELEYAVDAALEEAREAEAKLRHPSGTS